MPPITSVTADVDGPARDARQGAQAPGAAHDRVPLPRRPLPRRGGSRRSPRAGPEGIELDRTIFYASSGGQPGDTGRIAGAAVTGAVHPDGDRARVLHLPAPGAALPGVGAKVALRLDWERRYRLMRMHSALHLLSVVLPYGVTGGQIGEDKGRLDFDMPEPPEDVAAHRGAAERATSRPGCRSAPSGSPRRSSPRGRRW